MRVVATAKGFDGVTIREIGEEFEVADTMFDKRPKLDPTGKPTGQFYDAPSWFKPVEPKTVEGKGKTTEKKDGKDLV